MTEQPGGRLLSISISDQDYHWDRGVYSADALIKFCIVTAIIFKDSMIVSFNSSNGKHAHTVLDDDRALTCHI